MIKTGRSYTICVDTVETICIMEIYLPWIWYSIWCRRCSQILNTNGQTLHVDSPYFKRGLFYPRAPKREEFHVRVALSKPWPGRLKIARLAQLLHRARSNSASDGLTARGLLISLLFYSSQFLYLSTSICIRILLSRCPGRSRDRSRRR
jgi:hypothetical protein